MKRIVILGLVILAVASCSRVQSGLGGLGVGSGNPKGPRNIEVDDMTFRTSIDRSGEDKRNFTITVTPFTVNPPAALEAGRYKATVYCLRSYGGSDTEWAVGPNDPVEELPIVDNMVTLRGRCTQR